MTHVFSNTQIPLRLSTPEDFCLDDSVHLFLQATRRNESPLADILDEKERPFVYHTQHDGDIVFKPTTARSSQPVITSKQCTDFTTT